MHTGNRSQFCQHVISLQCVLHLKMCCVFLLTLIVLVENKKQGHSSCSNEIEVTGLVLETSTVRS